MAKKRGDVRKAAVTARPDLVMAFEPREQPGVLKLVQNGLLSFFRSAHLDNVRVSGPIKGGRIEIYGITEHYVAPIAGIVERFAMHRVTIGPPDQQEDYAAQQQATEQLAQARQQLTTQGSTISNLERQLQASEQARAELQRRHTETERFMETGFEELVATAGRPAFKTLEDAFASSSAQYGMQTAQQVLNAISDTVRSYNLALGDVLTLLRHPKAKDHPLYVDYEREQAEIAEARALAQKNPRLLRAWEEDQRRTNTTEASLQALLQLYSTENQARFKKLREELVGEEIKLAVYGELRPNPIITIILPFAATGNRTPLEEAYVQGLHAALADSQFGTGVAGTVHGALTWNYQLPQDIRRPELDLRVDNLVRFLADMDNPFAGIGVGQRVISLQSTIKYRDGPKRGDSVIDDYVQEIEQPSEQATHTQSTHERRQAIIQQINPTTMYSVAEVVQLTGRHPVTVSGYYNRRKEAGEFEWVQNSEGTRLVRGSDVITYVNATRAVPKKSHS